VAPPRDSAARAAHRAVAELIPLTVPEVRWLLWGVVWRTFPSVEQVLAWSTWRRHHQARRRWRQANQPRTHSEAHLVDGMESVTP
jgi:hypothetical protein